MEKRVPYRVYKKTYPTAKTVPGSYDAASKTIIIMPEAASHLRFAPSEWTASGNSKCLKGHSITILQWNTGAEANFALEAHETTERVERSCSIICNGYDHTEAARHIYRTIPGFGADARDEAIRQAKELAETGKYVIA